MGSHASTEVRKALLRIVDMEVGDPIVVHPDHVARLHRSQTGRLEGGAPRVDVFVSAASCGKSRRVEPRSALLCSSRGLRDELEELAKRS